MKNNHLHPISFLVLRVMGSLIFIMAGFNHLFQTAAAAARLEKAQLGHLATWLAPAEPLIILSGIGLLTGGFLLLAGFKTRLASLLLLSILFPITLTIQVVNPAGSGPLFKNIALMGMLLFFMVNGAMHYGLDQFLNRKKVAAPDNRLRTGKHIAIVAAFLMLLLGACATTAPGTTAPTQQAVIPTKQKYTVLISQPNHLKAAVNTAETIVADSRYNRESFVIMACGKSVEAFVKGSEMEQEFQKGIAAGVTYKVCGMSLKKFNIAPSSLPENIEVVPNGLTYMFDLQLQGYQTVEL